MAFKLKNPCAINDDFWAQFIYYWVGMVSYLSNAATFILSGDKGLSLLYYTCIGTNPDELEESPYQNGSKFSKMIIRRGPTYAVVVVSLLIQLILGIKLKFQKKKSEAVQKSQPLRERIIHTW